MKTVECVALYLFFLIIPQFLWSQNVTISGFVFNQNTGEVVESASIFESIEGIGTISNTEGFYKLFLKPGDMKLKISNPGFETFSKIFELKKDTTLTIWLKPEKTGKIKTESGLQIGKNIEKEQVISMHRLKNK